jgi:aconitate hydratase
MNILNSFGIGDELFYYYDLEKVFSSYEELNNLPISLKILLEENLRKAKDDEEIEYIIDAFLNRKNSKINLYPSRIIMQDFSVIPMLMDFASFIDYLIQIGSDVNKINPKIMIDLIIDDFEENDILEAEKNIDKYKFIKWAQNSFNNFRVIPPGSGVYHRINLEYLSTIIHLEEENERKYLFPETNLIEDSNSSITNSLGVLNWKVDNVHLELAMLGHPISINFPKVLGIGIKGKLKTGVISSDLVFNIIQKLKEYKNENQIVEFFGEGICEITLEDRITILNEAYTHNIKSIFFPIDNRTLLYYNNTRDNDDFSKFIKVYLEKQKLFFESKDLSYDEIIEVDLNLIEPYIFEYKKTNTLLSINILQETPIIKEGLSLKDADIIFISILACQNSFNPYLLIHAGLLIKKAFELGFKPSDNIKKLLILKSDRVKIYLEKLDLLKYFVAFGFDLVDSSFEKSMNLEKNLEEDIKKNTLNVISLSSTNESLYEKKLSSLIKSKYVMSPSLIIIYALTKTIKCNIFEEFIFEKITLEELWPSYDICIEYLNKLDYSFYKNIYDDIFKGNLFWQEIKVSDSKSYNWDNNSTNIQASEIFINEEIDEIKVENAGILVLLGNDITSDYISFQGQINLYSEAGNYLEQKGIKSFDYGTFASRSGNAEIMVRGIFDNISLNNKMISKEGGFTKDFEKDEIVSIFELSKRFKERNRPLVIFAGENFGKGKTNIWAVKGIKMLGIKAIIAKSFDEEYKSNLVAFGIFPFEFGEDEDSELLNLRGDEIINITLNEELKPNCMFDLTISSTRDVLKTKLICKLDSYEEIDYYKKGGLLSFLLKSFI